jgi:uncharacterized membrane protein YphA (DoxX/SURF4 family)
LVVAAVLTAEGIHELRRGDALSTSLALLTFCSATLLLAGLWTTIGGVVAVLVGLSAAIVHPVDIWEQILIVTEAAAITMLGPGAWSVDARLFGWKRIAIGDPRR